MSALPRIIIGTSACNDTEILTTYANGLTALIKNRGRRFITV